MSDEERKVCGGCGYGPVSDEDERFCKYCGDKLVTRAELPRDIWKDPYVREALKGGRQSWDIAVMRCSSCHQLGYYNQGSHFSCRFCDKIYHVSDDDEVLRLDDTVTECDGGYHNHTL